MATLPFATTTDTRDALLTIDALDVLAHLEGYPGALVPIADLMGPQGSNREGTLAALRLLLGEGRVALAILEDDNDSEEFWFTAQGGVFTHVHTV